MENVKKSVQYNIFVLHPAGNRIDNLEKSKTYDVFYKVVPMNIYTLPENCIVTLSQTIYQPIKVFFQKHQTNNCFPDCMRKTLRLLLKNLKPGRNCVNNINNRVR